MKTSSFFVLLPPSEGKAPGGSGTTRWNPGDGAFGGALDESRRQVVRALASLDGGSQKLLGVSGVHLARAQSANLALRKSPTMPAWQRYTGVVWDHLELASLPAARRRSMLRRILVPSGLFGLVRADDEIPDYRLKMGARPEPLGLMSSWWRHDITQALADHVGRSVVVDLLPKEHHHSIEWSEIPGALRIELVAKSGGAVGGHDAKAAKGLLARHLLCAGGADIADAVSRFRHGHYKARITT